MRGHCPSIWVCPLAHFFGTKPKLSIIPLFFPRKVYKRKSGFLANLVTKWYLWARKQPETAVFDQFRVQIPPFRCPLLISLLAILPTFFGHMSRNLGTNAHNFFSKVGIVATYGQRSGSTSLRFTGAGCCSRKTYVSFQMFCHQKSTLPGRPCFF